MPDEQPQVVEEEIRQSMLSWLIHSAGGFGLLVLLSALIVFLGALIVLFASRRPAVIAACFPWLLLPLWLGFLGALWGGMQWFLIVAGSPIFPEMRHLGDAVSTALISPFLALLLTFPSYLVLSAGLFLRTIAAGKQTSAGA